MTSRRGKRHERAPERPLAGRGGLDTGAERLPPHGADERRHLLLRLVPRVLRDVSDHVETQELALLPVPSLVERDRGAGGVVASAA